MKDFNKEQRMEEILLSFKEIDGQRENFTLHFYEHILQVLNHFYPHFSLTKTSKVLLNAYAMQIQNVTESIDDKDTTYSTHRLEEELANLTRVTSRHFEVGEFNDLYHQLIKVVKALMVESNPDVFELSANGFRLMEANAILYSQHFLTELSRLEELN